MGDLSLPPYGETGQVLATRPLLGGIAGVWTAKPLLIERPIVGGVVRLLGLGVVAAMILVWLLYYTVLTAFMVKELHLNDFGKFYYSTRLFLDGQDMYGSSPATAIPVSETEVRQFLNMNPPHFHFLTLPLAALSPVRAYFVWTIMNLVALAMSLQVISRELRVRWSVRKVAWSFAALIFCSATGTIVVTGQLTFLLLLPVTLSWIAARNGNWSKSALYLGLCASVKPFFGIFLIYLLLRRYVKPAAVMVLTGIACGAAGLAVFRWSAYQRWLDALSAVDWAWAPMNGSIGAVIARSFGENPLYSPILFAPSLIAPVTGALGVLVGIVSFRILLRTSNKQADHVFGGLLLTAQLISPLGWIYYAWLLLGPMVALYQARGSHACQWRDRLALAATPGLIIPFTLIGLWNSSPWQGLTLGSVYTWTMLFLWGSVMADCVGRSGQREPEAAAGEPWRVPEPSLNTN